jgi:hypothetical protein
MSTRNTLSKKILSYLLAMAMTFTMLPLVAIPAYAAGDFTTIQVGNGSSLSATTDQSGTDWTWTAATNTLNLTNTTISSDGITILGGGAGKTANIVISGTVNVAGQISCNGLLVIKGSSDSDVLNATQTDNNSPAIAAVYDITLETITVNVSTTGTYSHCIVSTNGGFNMVSGELNLSATGTGSGGVFCQAGNINISGTAQVRTNPSVTDSGLYGEPNVNISGSAVVDITSIDNVAVTGANVTISGGTVTAKSAGSYGAMAGFTGGVTVTGGAVTVGGVGENNGNIYGDITVSGSGANVTVNGNITNNGNLTVSDGTVSVTGNVTGDLSVSGGAVGVTGNIAGDFNVSGGAATVSGTVSGATTHTGGTVNGQSPPTGVAPAITTTTLPNGTVGAAYSRTLAATGDTPITWSLDSGTLPGGLSLSVSTGVISGIPTTEGTANFTVKAANGTAPDATQALSIIINSPPTGVAPSITTTALPNGTIGAAYSRTLAATGDTLITWSIASGKLPNGLTLNPSAGVISGTPTKSGTFSFTVKAENGTLPDATQALSITIKSPGGRVTLPPQNTKPTPGGGYDSNTHQHAYPAKPERPRNIITTDGSDGISVTITAPAGTVISADNRVRIGAEGATVSIRFGSDGSQPSLTLNIAPGVILLLDENAPLGYSVVSSHPFTDVKESDWFNDNVVFTYAHNLIAGTGATAFSPNTPETRAMFVSVLYRLAGKPAVRMNEAFDDVIEGKWYYEAVNWAAQSGIVSGVGGNKFAPDNAVTREQMAAILVRYARFMNIDLPKKRDGIFADQESIGAWAKEAVDTMYAAGILSGKSGGVFDPKGSATRAEVAAVLHRFIINQH